MINNAISGSDLQNMNFLNVITRIKDGVRFVSFTPDFSQVTSGARVLGETVQTVSCGSPAISTWLKPGENEIGNQSSS